MMMMMMGYKIGAVMLHFVRVECESWTAPLLYGCICLNET